MPPRTAKDQTIRDIRRAAAAAAAVAVAAAVIAARAVTNGQAVLTILAAWIGVAATLFAWWAARCAHRIDVEGVDATWRLR